MNLITKEKYEKEKQKFLKIEEQYIKQKEVLKNLKKGDFVYIDFPRFFDIEYYKIEIDEVFVDEGYVTGFDLSLKGKRVDKLTNFYTEEEFNNL